MSDFHIVAQFNALDKVPRVTVNHFLAEIGIGQLVILSDVRTNGPLVVVKPNEKIVIEAEGNYPPNFTNILKTASRCDMKFTCPACKMDTRFEQSTNLVRMEYKGDPVSSIDEPYRTTRMTALELFGPKFTESELEFICKNCRHERFKFWIKAAFDPYQTPADSEVLAYKLGQHPVIIAPIPPQLDDLLEEVGREVKTLFRKGYTMERLGYGVAAFVYYRKALELKKNKLVGIFMDQARGADMPVPPGVIEALKKAENDTQFTAALEDLILPPELNHGGKKLLVAVYRDLSEGLHSGDDAACLQIAQDVRILMQVIAEKLVSYREHKKSVSGALAAMTEREQRREAAKANRSESGGKAS